MKIRVNWVHGDLVRAGLLCLVMGIIGLQTANGQEQAVPQTKFWHLAIVVRDMEKMHDFYTRVVGLKNVSDLAFSDASSVPPQEPYQALAGLDELMAMTGTRVKIRHYTDPDHEQFLELMYYPDRPTKQLDRAMYKPMGFNHLGLQVPDLDHALNIIRGERIGSIVGGPVILNEFGGNRYVILKDPEGNLVELYELAKHE